MDKTCFKCYNTIFKVYNNVIQSLICLTFFITFKIIIIPYADAVFSI